MFLTWVSLTLNPYNEVDRWHNNLDNPNPSFRITFLHRNTCIRVTCSLVWLQEHISQTHVLERDWTACLKYDNHSRLDSQHNWGKGGGGEETVYDHLMSTRIFALIMNKIILSAPKIVRKLSTASIWIR